MGYTDYKHACVLSHSSGVRLFATLRTAAHQASLSTGILQARKLEWVAMPSSRGSSPPRGQTRVSCIGRRILYPLSHPDAPSLIDSSRLTGELQEFRKHLGALQQARGHGPVVSLFFLSASVSLSFRGGSRFFPGIYTNV